ncbi:unnamed protein product [Caenorhabditis auriculariae]|uniref:ELM2 domain-containing protein n=1 Tax=Caenorhabditis auriculariae TaxID=2777116 RepID=A0A8S1HTD1_9PELO|nr:unnamed protein product [Caenorhabditis auriculariae]
MEEEFSRSSIGDDEEFDENLEDGEDCEATIDEEELLEDGEDYADELKDLEDEGEMTLEDLRRKYGVGDECDNGDYKDAPQTSSETNVQGPSSLPNELSYLDEMANSLSGNEDEDGDYAPPDLWRRQVRVNAELYQAEIPDLLAKDDQANYLTPDEAKALLLWSNPGNEKMTSDQIDEYLRDVVALRIEHEQSFPEKANRNRDDEDALCALLRNDFDVKKAKEAFPFPCVNAPVRSVRSDALAWDENECKLFEKSLEQFGKDFSTIRRHVFPYRHVGEIVEHYYRWKLTIDYKVWRLEHPHSATTSSHLHYDHWQQVTVAARTSENDQKPSEPTPTVTH